MKNEPLFTRVQTTPLVATVSAAPGSAGTAIASTLACSRVRLRNKSRSVPVEFKVGSGAWTLLRNREDSEAALPVNLSATQVFLRKGVATSEAVSVDVSIDVAAGIFPGDDAAAIGSFAVP